MQIEKPYNPFMEVLFFSDSFFKFIAETANVEILQNVVLHCLKIVSIWDSILAAGSTIALNFYGMVVWNLTWQRFSSISTRIEDFETRLPRHFYCYKFLTSCIKPVTLEPFHYICKTIGGLKNTNYFFYHFQSTAPLNFFPITENTKTLVAIVQFSKQAMIILVEGVELRNNLIYCKKGLFYNSENGGVYNLRAIKINSHGLFIKALNFKIFWKDCGRKITAAEVFSIF